jgi:glycosyltransferase involved in cell wall biosynthesis
MTTLGLFTPYSLDPGGGERYLLSIAEAMRGAAEVYLITPAEQPLARLEELARQLDLRIDHLRPISYADAKSRAPFDLTVVMGNEVLPPIPALGRKNVFLCQFPFPAKLPDLARRSPFWADYESVVVYSDYAKAHTAKAQHDVSVPEKPIHVIHPPVAPLPAPPACERKNGMILSVGRFFSDGHSKRQDELIGAFRGLKIAKSSLHLAGTLHGHPVSQEMFARCQAAAGTLPVTFYPNADRAELARLYAQSDCYWHGAGLRADREKEPEKFEHFGITVVEAMASGCIPFVLDQGGPASIVTSAKNGWTYRTTFELTKKTSHFLTSINDDAIREMRAAARRRARDFSVEVFSIAWLNLLGADTSRVRRNGSSTSTSTIDWAVLCRYGFNDAEGDFIWANHEFGISCAPSSTTRVLFRSYGRQGHCLHYWLDQNTSESKYELADGLQQIAITNATEHDSTCYLRIEPRVHNPGDIRDLGILIHRIWTGDEPHSGGTLLAAIPSSSSELTSSLGVQTPKTRARDPH